MAFTRNPRELLGRPNLVVADAAPDHPLIAGRTELGRGEYTIVFDSPDPSRVYKLVSSPADYFFLTADDRPRGPYFPVVHADHGVLGRASSGYLFHLVEVERLLPLAPGSAAARLAERLTDAYWQGCEAWSHLGANMGRVALYHLTQSPPDLPPDLVQALRDLSDFVEEYQIQPDLLGENNLMQRADGALVLSDPVFIA